MLFKKNKDKSLKPGFFKNKPHFSFGLLRSLRSGRTIFSNQVISSILLIVISLGASGLVSFNISKNTVDTQFKSSTEQILNQYVLYTNQITASIKSTGIKMMQDRNLVSALKLKPADINEEAANKSNIKTMVKNYYSSDASNSMVNISLFVDNNVYGGINTEEDTLLTDAPKQDWYKKAKDSSAYSAWTAPNMFNVDHTQNYPMMSYIMKFVDSSSKHLAVMKIDVKPKAFSAGGKDIVIGKTGYAFIADAEGKFIYSKDPSLVSKSLPKDITDQITKNKSGSFSTKLDSKNMQLMYITSEETGWKYIAVMPISELYAASRTIGTSILIITLLLVIGGVFFSIWTTSHITKPIKDIIKTTRELSTGNLTVKSPSYKLKELNELGCNFNSMVDKLRDMMQNASDLAVTTSKHSGSLLNISHGITLTSQEISDTVESIASGSSSQTTEAVNCAEIYGNFNSMITEAINSVTKVGDLTDATTGIIDESSAAVDKLTEASRNNSTAMQKVEETISTLNSNTKDVLKIVDNIKAITEQTNLLSLNASIEAARAGEAGRGFAVVANEIRKLADQSQAASQQIKQIITNVNNSIKSSLQITEAAQVTFDEESHQVAVTVKVFGTIKDNIANINTAMEEAKELISIIDKDKDFLNKSINNIAEISEKNTASTEEVTASVQNQANTTNSIYNLAQELTENSDKLKQAINKFKF